MVDFVKLHVTAFADDFFNVDDIVNEEERHMKLEERQVMLHNAFKRLFNPKALREKVKGVVGREQDDDIEKEVFKVHDDYLTEKNIRSGLQATVEFNFINPVAAAVELLVDDSIRAAQNYILEAKAWSEEFGEMNTGNWWRYAERVSGVRTFPNTFIMPIAFYTDGASVDFRKSISLKPISIACMNLVGRIVRSPRGKMTIGYFPTLPGDTSSSESMRRLNRELYHWVVKKLVASIEKYRDGIIIQLNGEKVTMVPVICFVLTDWPEGQKMASMYASPVGPVANCRVCLRETKDFGNVVGGEAAGGIRRTQAETDALLRKAKGLSLAQRKVLEKPFSMHLEENGFRDAELFSGRYGIHALCPMDTLHTVPYGLVEPLKLLVLAHTEVALRRQVLDDRLRQMPRTADTRSRGLPYRHFPKGLTGVGTWAASDYVALIQQLPFIVGYKQQVIASQKAQKAFLQACHYTRTILLVQKMEVPNEIALSWLHEAATKMGLVFLECQDSLTAEQVKKQAMIARPKMHALYHYRYGTTATTTTTTTTTAAAVTIDSYHAVLICTICSTTSYAPPLLLCCVSCLLPPHSPATSSGGSAMP